MPFNILRSYPLALLPEHFARIRLIYISATTSTHATIVLCVGAQSFAAMRRLSLQLIIESSPMFRLRHQMVKTSVLLQSLANVDRTFSKWQPNT